MKSYDLPATNASRRDVGLIPTVSQVIPLTVNVDDPTVPEAAEVTS